MRSLSVVKISVVAVTLIALTGCSIHSRHHVRHGHHHGYHGHTSVHVHGHGRAAKALGILAAGAIIGHVIHEASKDDEPEAPPQAPLPKSYYLKTLEGDCVYVQQDRHGETRTPVAHSYCDQ
ncbi:hypothetical protein [Pleionea sp. CnH1-48]|uniref:hypothetical protein n=1 Tax=Pleionea sp. CnH1-48 TaxID=2954494 RepID=UPI0020970853|nr:hypothetical protein [Pleionea sp. CnH1-48]MCO7225326.1 hypothetical protein [Pleionea sp. CnH1-48]